MTLKELVENEKKVKETLYKEIHNINKKVFSEGIKLLFEENPGLISFKFHGYCPAYNDGDPPTFRVSYGDAVINDLDFDYGDVKDDTGEIRKSQKPLKQAICTLFYGIDDDFLQIIWGDSFDVTITKDNIQIDEYYP